MANACISINLDVRVLLTRPSQNRKIIIGLMIHDGNIKVCPYCLHSIRGRYVKKVSACLLNNASVLTRASRFAVAALINIKPVTAFPEFGG